MNVLRDYRTHADVTQAKMASLMDIPLRTYEDLEAGRSQVRAIHVNAVQMAVIRLAIDRNDVSVLPAEMWPGLEHLGRLIGDWNRLANPKPTDVQSGA